MAASTWAGRAPAAAQACASRAALPVARRRPRLTCGLSSSVSSMGSLSIPGIVAEGGRREETPASPPAEADPDPPSRRRSLGHRPHRPSQAPSDRAGNPAPRLVGPAPRRPLALGDALQRCGDDWEDPGPRGASERERCLPGAWVPWGRLRHGWPPARGSGPPLRTSLGTGSTSTSAAFLQRPWKPCCWPWFPEIITFPALPQAVLAPAKWCWLARVQEARAVSLTALGRSCGPCTRNHFCEHLGISILSEKLSALSPVH